MYYIAIDLHRKRSYLHATDEDGNKILARQVQNSRETFQEILAKFDPTDTELCVEATYGWEWLADLLEEEGFKLRLVHPLMTKAIAAARVKTDAVDAKTLAHLLRTDLLPEAYIAPRDQRDLRDLLRQRFSLTQKRTALKNAVHAQLARFGILHEYSDIFGKAGMEFLHALEIRRSAKDRIEVLLRLKSDFDREVDLLKAQIDELAKDDPAVSVLTQLPGIGNYTAMLIIAEIGDIDRFSSARHLCSWAGITPKVYSSDKTMHMGHISRQGPPHLRWALVEAAQKAARSKDPGPLRKMFERIAKRRGSKIARVAVARQLLTLCYYGLRDGEIRCLKPKNSTEANAGLVMAAAA